MPKIDVKPLPHDQYDDIVAALDVTRADLAKICGVEPDTIGWYRFKKKIPTEHLKAIQAAFEMRLKGRRDLSPVEQRARIHIELALASGSRIAMLTQADINQRLIDGYYKNKLKYPFPNDYKCECGENFSFLFPPNFCAKCGIKVDPFLKAYKALEHAYKIEEGRIHQEFVKDVYEALEISDNPKRELLFSKAWENGHSGGYGDVWSCLQDLVELIREV